VSVDDNPERSSDTRPVAGYVRVSTDRQETERQEASIPQRHRSLPDGLADRPLELFYDHGVSAWSGTTRPGFEEMFARIERGEFSALLIDTSSRLTRRGVREAITLLMRLEDARCRLFTTQGREYSFDPRDLISLVIDAESDERYSANLSHNITTAKDVQRKSGRYPHGQLPPGYRRTQHGQLEATADLTVVAELYRLFLAGRTYQQLCGYANDHLSADALSRLKNGADHYRVRAWLRSPLYVGLLPHKGQAYEGDHKPAVTREVWDAAQAKLDRNRAANAARSPRKWPFAGIAKCWCGHSLRLHRVGRHVYLRCHDRSCRTNSHAPKSPIFEANVIVGLVAIAFAITDLLAADRDFAAPTENEDDTYAAARQRLEAAKHELNRVTAIIIKTGGTADDPRIIHLLDQRDAAAEHVAMFTRSTLDYREELRLLAQAIFSLRFHVPAWLQASLSKDWAMLGEAPFLPAFPDELAEAVLLGWQYAPFEERVTIIREALSAVVYQHDSIEWRFRSALPEAIFTSTALDPERSPIFLALDEDGWGSSAYHEALLNDPTLAKPQPYDEVGVSESQPGPAQAHGRGDPHR
jgi:DNA invertase Pin-like site-specific DNA recombinase